MRCRREPSKASNFFFSLTRGEKKTHIVIFLFDLSYMWENVKFEAEIEKVINLSPPRR